MLFLETSSESMTLFTALVIVLVIALGIVVLLITLKTNRLFPFHKMHKEDEDNCYDMNLRKSRSIKKDERGNKWKH